MSVPLAPGELDRLKKAVTAYLSLPSSPDLAPDAAEEILAWAVEGTTHASTAGTTRSKLLFDVVRAGVGWSLKTFKPSSLNSGQTFEVVLARASLAIIQETGPDEQPQLAVSASPSADPVELNGDDGQPLEPFNLATATAQDVGNRVLAIRRRVLVHSSEHQEIADPREAFLLRSKDNKEFAYFEHPLTVESPEEVEWNWTDERTRKGIQGLVEGVKRYRWYPSGAQLFGCFQIPDDEVERFEVEWNRITWDELFERMTQPL